MNVLKKNVYWPIVFLLLIQQYVSSELFWMLGFAICVYYVANSRLCFTIPFKEYKLLFVFIPWGLVLGIISFGKGCTEIIDIIRDIFYYMNPLIFLFIGSVFAKKDISIYRILNAFIIASAIICLMQLVKIAGNLANMGSIMSVYHWRKIVGDGHIVTGVALAVTMSKIIPLHCRIPKLSMVLSTIISSTYFIITMSRTNILVFLILFATILFQKEKSKKMLSRLVSVFFVSVIVLAIGNFLLPKEVSSAFTEKMISSFSEISSRQSWTSVSNIQANWRGYETHCAIEQWKESGYIIQLFGSGFGKRIYVGEYAYSLLGQVDSSGSAAESIAVLHNGYASQLIKMGILGVILYVFYYMMIIKKAIDHKKIKDTLEVRILLGVGIVFLIQTYFLNGFYKDYVFFPTIILMGYTAYKIERNKDIICTQSINNYVNKKG